MRDFGLACFATRARGSNWKANNPADLPERIDAPDTATVTHDSTTYAYTVEDHELAAFEEWAKGVFLREGGIWGVSFFSDREFTVE